MKKIPTLFEREFQGHKIVGITEKVASGMEWVLEGKGIATEKIDGACCAIIDGEFYKRYDAKRGKKAPEGAIPCCDPDPVTGHHPHWVKVDPNNPSDKWFLAAHDNTAFNVHSDGTYEAIGPHFNGNPYNLAYDSLVRHGIIEIDVGRSFSEIREYLRGNVLEGIVFWLDGEPKCKIKRSDFGFLWPVEVEG